VNVHSVGGSKIDAREEEEEKNKAGGGEGGEPLRLRGISHMGERGGKRGPQVGRKKKKGKAITLRFPRRKNANGLKKGLRSFEKKL